jgi:mono/diheme cytochrome c family protein
MKKLFLLVLLALAGFGWWYVRVHGFSARAEPLPVEKLVAERLRHLSVPAAERDLKNPLPLTDANVAEGRAHFADHCAVCHGNDGRGETEMGQGLYPKAPDMRDHDTQEMTDGEIFYIIKNGVRFTGMPAWGATEGHADDEDNWKLVHFIRHLPKQTPQEIQEMEALNPKGHEHGESSEDEEKFLRGEDAPAAAPGSPSPAPSAHTHTH